MVRSFDENLKSLFKAVRCSGSY